MKKYIVIICLLIASVSQGETHLKKNAATELMFPLLSRVSPEAFKTGEIVTGACYYKDGAGSWTSLSVAGSVTEIGSSGIYTLPLLAGEMNHDKILCKFSASNSADTAITIKTYTQDIDVVATQTSVNAIPTSNPSAIDIRQEMVTNSGFCTATGLNALIPEAIPFTNHRVDTNATVTWTPSDDDIQRLADAFHLDYDTMARIVTEAVWTRTSRTLTEAPVILPAMQGSAYNGIAMQSKEVPIVAGNTPRIPFAIVDINGKPANYTGWSAKFGAKQQPGYSDYAIALKDAVWIDASKGQGYIDLTAEDTAQVGRIYGEIQLTSGSQVLTPLRFLLNIIQPVIGP